MAQAERVVYDTLAAVRRLTGSGMPEPQAEAVVREHASVLEHHIATRNDLKEFEANIEARIEALRKETENLRKETEARIENLRKETATRIEALREETKAQIKLLRQETETRIEAAKNSTIKWVIGMNIALMGLVIAGFTFAIQLMMN